MSDAAQAMLQIVADYERSQCEALRTRAGDESAQHLREAHRAARAQMRRHVQELKQLRERERTRARAEFFTTERQVLQHRDQALLRRAWPQLADALRRRWADTGARQQWVATVFERARQVLRPGAWRVLHPRDWPAAEQARVAGGETARMQFVADAAITAGLRICADGACVDGTPEALLGDRAVAEARLLTLLADR